MTQDDREDVKPATHKERLAIARDVTKHFMGHISDLVHEMLRKHGEEMFREGVIAGLRVTESGVSSDATLRVYGRTFDDVKAIQPQWCECDPNADGGVCSSCRWSAECDTAQARQAEDDARDIFDE